MSPDLQGWAAAENEDAFTANYRKLLDSVHGSMAGVDRSVADNSFHLFRLVKEQLDQGMRDRYALAQVADRLQVSPRPPRSYFERQYPSQRFIIAHLV